MQDWKKLKDKKRIVIKIGTSSLTYPNGKLHLDRIEKLSHIMAQMVEKGLEVILVSSGAIGVGATRLGLHERPEKISKNQALAAVGQAELIKIYQKFFESFDQTVAQVLLTKDGIEHEKRKINARNTLQQLLSMKIVPIINENDTVAVEEIVFGDNDTLSADVAILAGADLLILLTDIDGLYDKDPKANKDAKLITKVPEINDTIKNLAAGKGSSFSKGGMITKIQAAEKCAKKGIETVIANGENPEILLHILNGEEMGTLFYNG